ncbi:hypothetical protein ES703_123749 [subsurface metagenome]
MESTKPNVFIINIHPENWKPCNEDHIFGLRKGARHPVFRTGDVFLVRMTGTDYGVTGIWIFKEEEDISDSHKVPWFDAEYTILLTYDPLVDFETPMSEEFTGPSKYSKKIQISAARLIGSVAIIYESEIVRYFEMILEEKAKECLATTVYQGKTLKIADVLQRFLGYYRKKEAKPEPSPEKAKRGMIVGEVIDFRGMVYAPLNEAGVVLLFSKVMDDLGVVYESSPTKGFDMVGRLKTKLGLELNHFEFEYQSSNFKAHGHDPSLVDYLVCWEHDWKDCPKDLEVWELKEIIKNLPAEFHRELESD